MGTTTLIINSKVINFSPGQTIMEVAKTNSIYIPHLCFLKNTIPTGACRICLVEVKNARTLVASCATPATAGMEIKTDTNEVHKNRRLNVELLLASGDHNCLTCEKNSLCKLQNLAYLYSITKTRFTSQTQQYPSEKDNPFIVRDFSKCILCGRCIQACNEIQVNQAIGYGYRGTKAKIITSGDRPYHKSDCVFCGQCIEVCPVGALTEKKALGQGRPWETTKVQTTCPYCGVGCQMFLHVNNKKVIKITSANGPANKKLLCVKGRFGYDFINSPDRLTTPLIKNKNGQFKKATWDEALRKTAKKINTIKEQYGPNALAGLTSARITNEENYLFQKIFRTVIGTNNIDHCARL